GCPRGTFWRCRHGGVLRGVSCSGGTRHSVHASDPVCCADNDLVSTDVVVVVLVTAATGVQSRTSSVLS
ncbi:MAG TPA: hypothetical protein VF788_14220, partial [Pseudonocardiaceae bacterium]